MLEIKSKKYSVKLDDVVYNLSPLKVSQIREIEKAKGELGIEAIIKIVSDAGMPVDVVEGMDADALNDVVLLLTGKNKAS